MFAVYTASNFHKLYFQPQNMYYHSEVTLNFCQKRAPSDQLHGREQHIRLIQRLTATVQ